MDKETALKLHRQMWSDMRKELGDCPNAEEREAYKQEWCRKQFPYARIMHNCFLCKYTGRGELSSAACIYCPIDWSSLQAYKGANNRCFSVYKGGGKNGKIYLDAPISEILALPER